MTFLFLIISFIFGAVIGSFINVVALRFLKNETITGRSYCPACHHQLSSLDLVPLFSFFLLQGKCLYCQAKISWRYPLVELATGLIFALVFLTWFPVTLTLLSLVTLVFQFFVAAVLIIVFLTDLSEGLILDKIIFPSIAVAFLYQILILVLYPTHFPLTIVLLNLATGVGIGLFFLILILITGGRGMGGGDFKLSIFIGLALGWPLAVLAIFLAFLTGSLGSVMLLLTGKKGLKSSVPFGPFLALGAIITIVAGNQILELYLKTLGL